MITLAALRRPFTINRLRHVHWLLGLAPFAWLPVMLILVSRGIWLLGRLPGYKDPIPEGWDPAGALVILLALVGIGAAINWLVISILLLIVAPDVLRRNTASVALCLLGIGSSIVLLWTTDLFRWVLGY